MHLLIVEDEHAIRSALARGLARHGDTVAAVATLAEARLAAQAQRPDALVSDLKLPDGIGTDLARELAVPFILMTGYGTFDDAVAALRIGGCMDFFTKPVPLRDLRQALERIASARLRGGAILDLEGPALVSPVGDWISAEILDVAAARWTSPTEARARFSELAAFAPAACQRQVLSELLQATEAGRVVVNHGEDRWQAWLDAGDQRIDWATQADRRQVLEGLTTSCRWLANGAMVECGRG